MCRHRPGGQDGVSVSRVSSPSPWPLREPTPPCSSRPALTYKLCARGWVAHWGQRAGLWSEHPGCPEGELMREGIQDEICSTRECGEKVAQGTACHFPP